MFIYSFGTGTGWDRTLRTCVSFGLRVMKTRLSPILGSLHEQEKVSKDWDTDS